MLGFDNFDDTWNTINQLFVIKISGKVTGTLLNQSYKRQWKKKKKKKKKKEKTSNVLIQFFTV